MAVDLPLEEQRLFSQSLGVLCSQDAWPLPSTVQNPDTENMSDTSKPEAAASDGQLGLGKMCFIDHQIFYHLKSRKEAQGD